MEPKFNINEIVYLISDYKLIPCQIEQFIITQDANGLRNTYKIKTISNDPNHKVIEKVVIEACLVKDFKEAKEAALTNWERIYEYVKNQLNEMVPFEKTDDTK